MTEKRIKFQNRITANWEKLDVVTGRVLMVDVADIKGKKRRFMDVKTADGDVQVFESAALEEAFKIASIGDFVRFENLGTVETSNNRTFRQFRVQVWEDPDAEPIKVDGRRARKARS